MRRLYPSNLTGTAPAYVVGEDAVRACVDVLCKLPRVAVDIETEGLGADSFRVKAVIIASESIAAVLDGHDETHRRAARDVLTTVPSLIFHNSPFDCPPLVSAGYMRLSDTLKVTDTLVWARMAYTDELSGRGLGDLEPRLLSDQFATSDKGRLALAGKIQGLKKGDVFRYFTYEDPVYVAYAGFDGIITHRLHDPLWKAARDQMTNHPFGRYGADAEQAAYVLEKAQKINRLTLYRSAKGLRVDAPLVHRQVAALTEEQQEHESVMQTWGMTDWSNRNQLIAALEAAGELPEDHPRTDTGRASTTKEHMKSIKHPLAAAFRSYDERRRQIQYMTAALDTAEASDGRLHPQVNVMGAATGRMSISNPPLQQMQGESRHAILPDDGEELTSIDYTSIEPYVAACLAGDAEVFHKYDNEIDLYELPAKEAGIERKPAKILDLADLYGQGLTRAARQFGHTEDEARRIKGILRQAKPNTAALIEYSRRWGELAGKTFTLDGRIVDVQPQFAYKSTNFLCQGSAADILQHHMEVMYDRGMLDEFYVSMHDELVISTASADEVREIMSTPPPRLAEITGRTQRIRTDREDMGDCWKAV